MTRKTHDGLYLKKTSEHGYFHMVVCSDTVAGGLAYDSMDRCIDGTSDEANMRRRLFRESRKMLAEAEPVNPLGPTLPSGVPLYGGPNYSPNGLDWRGMPIDK